MNKKSVISPFVYIKKIVFMTKIKKNKTGNWDKKIAVACITKRSNHYRLTKCHFDIRTVKVCTKESRPNINGKLFL